jgi:alpha-1,2-mannosyltransferase
VQVPVEECDYLIDLDFPLHPIASTLEPRYATMTDTWERVSCHPFLDARHSFLITRTFWLPGKTWQSHNEFGDFCLLKNRKRVEQKEIEVARRIGNFD